MSDGYCLCSIFFSVATINNSSCVLNIPAALEFGVACASVTDLISAADRRTCSLLRGSAASQWCIVFRNACPGSLYILFTYSQSWWCSETPSEQSVYFSAPVLSQYLLIWPTESVHVWGCLDVTHICLLWNSDCLLAQQWQRSDDTNEIFGTALTQETPRMLLLGFKKQLDTPDGWWYFWVKHTIEPHANFSASK